MISLRQPVTPATPSRWCHGVWSKPVCSRICRVIAVTTFVWPVRALGSSVCLTFCACQWTYFVVPVTLFVNFLNFHQAGHCRNLDWKHPRHSVRLEPQGQKQIIFLQNLPRDHFHTGVRVLGVFGLSDVLMWHWTCDYDDRNKSVKLSVVPLVSLDSHWHAV